MRERDQLNDLARRLMGVRMALGGLAFDEACHRARIAIARVVLDVANERALPRQLKIRKSKINHDWPK